MATLKQILFFSLFTVITSGAYAQIWFDIAPRVHVGPNGYYNAELFSDSDHDYSFRAQTSFGGRLGVNFGANHGLHFEAMYANHKQELTYAPSVTSVTEGNNMTWKGTELGLTYRFMSSITYLEIGPKYNMVSDLKHEISNVFVENDAYYEESYPSAVVGFGGYFVGNESVALALGLRLEYAFASITSSEGIDAGLPATDYVIRTSDIGDSTPLSVQLTAEISFGIGGVAKAGCGQRTFVFGQRFY